MWNVADFVTNSLYLATIALRLRAYYDVSNTLASSSRQNMTHILINLSIFNGKSPLYKLPIKVSFEHFNSIFFTRKLSLDWDKKKPLDKLDLPPIWIIPDEHDGWSLWRRKPNQNFTGLISLLEFLDLRNMANQETYNRNPVLTEAHAILIEVLLG